MEKVPDPVLDLDDEKLDETFAALANRRGGRSSPASQRARRRSTSSPRRSTLTLPAVSKHIKVLERAGLVVRARHAQYRPCALDAAPLAACRRWAEHYRPVWEASFDRMDDYLQSSKHEEGEAER